MGGADEQKTGWFGNGFERDFTVELK